MGDSLLFLHFSSRTASTLLIAHRSMVACWPDGSVFGVLSVGFVRLPIGLARLVPGLVARQSVGRSPPDAWRSMALSSLVPLFGGPFQMRQGSPELVHFSLTLQSCPRGPSCLSVVEMYEMVES